MKEIKYAFVVDKNGTVLSPTREEKAWYKIRKGQAKLLQLKPLTIQLNYEVQFLPVERKISVSVTDTSSSRVVPYRLSSPDSVQGVQESESFVTRNPKCWS